MKLKPCPFCGGEAKYIEKPIPMVICTKCEAQIRGYITKLIPLYYDQFLESLWNRRIK